MCEQDVFYFDYDCLFENEEQEMVEKGLIIGFDGKYYY